MILTTCGKEHRATNDPAVIQHTIFIIKENRTFDNYFGDFPGADGATWGRSSTGQDVPLAPINDTDSSSLCNGWACAVEAMDGGKMDGFDLTTGNLDAYGRMTQQDLPNYWTYARHFVLADRFFTAVHGPSFPNHLFTVAPQSGGVMDNVDGSQSGTYCDGTPSGLVPVMDNDGNVSYQSPCFDFQTLPDLLEAAGISWKYYGESGAFSPAFAIFITAHCGRSASPNHPSFWPTLLKGRCLLSVGFYRRVRRGSIHQTALARERTGARRS